MGKIKIFFILPAIMLLTSCVDGRLYLNAYFIDHSVNEVTASSDKLLPQEGGVITIPIEVSEIHTKFEPIYVEKGSRYKVTIDGKLYTTDSHNEKHAGLKEVKVPIPANDTYKQVEIKVFVSFYKHYVDSSSWTKWEERFSIMQEALPSGSTQKYSDVDANDVYISVDRGLPFKVEMADGWPSVCFRRFIADNGGRLEFDLGPIDLWGENATVRAGISPLMDAYIPESEIDSKQKMQSGHIFMLHSRWQLLLLASEAGKFIQFNSDCYELDGLEQHDTDKVTLLGRIPDSHIEGWAQSVTKYNKAVFSLGR